MNAWNIVLVTGLLTAAVSFFVAGIIHLLCALIHRFSKPVLELQAANPLPPESLSCDAEIAVAIASVKAYRIAHKK
jgi:hypothetical protein